MRSRKSSFDCSVLRFEVTYGNQSRYRNISYTIPLASFLMFKLGWSFAGTSHHCKAQPCKSLHQILGLSSLRSVVIQTHQRFTTTGLSYEKCRHITIYSRLYQALSVGKNIFLRCLWSKGALSNSYFLTFSSSSVTVIVNSFGNSVTSLQPFSFSVPDKPFRVLQNT